MAGAKRGAHGGIDGRLFDARGPCETWVIVYVEILRPIDASLQNERRERAIKIFRKNPSIMLRDDGLQRGDDHEILQRHVHVHSLECRLFLPEGFEALQPRHAGLSVLLLPEIIRRAADPMLAQHLGNGNAGFGFAQYRHDLRVRELRFPHRTLRSKLAEALRQTVRCVGKCTAALPQLYPSAQSHGRLFYNEKHREGEEHAASDPASKSDYWEDFEIH